MKHIFHNSYQAIFFVAIVFTIWNYFNLNKYVGGLLLIGLGIYEFYISYKENKNGGKNESRT